MGTSSLLLSTLRAETRVVLWLLPTSTKGWERHAEMNQSKRRLSVQEALCKKWWDRDRAQEGPAQGDRMGFAQGTREENSSSWEELAENKSQAGRQVPKKATLSR